MGFSDIALGKWRKATIVEYNFGQMAIKKEGKSELLVQLWEDNEKVRQVYQNRLMEVEVTPPESELSYESESSS